MMVESVLRARRGLSRIGMMRMMMIFVGMVVVMMIVTVTGNMTGDGTGVVTKRELGINLISREWIRRSCLRECRLIRLSRLSRLSRLNGLNG